MGRKRMDRLAAMETFVRVIETFLAAHPGLTMNVILDDRVIDLLEEGIDVALRMGSLENSSCLTAPKVVKCPHRVAGTRRARGGGREGQGSDVRLRQAVARAPEPLAARTSNLVRVDAGTAHASLPPRLLRPCGLAMPGGGGR